MTNPVLQMKRAKAWGASFTATVMQMVVELGFKFGILLLTQSPQSRWNVILGKHGEKTFPGIVGCTCQVAEAVKGEEERRGRRGRKD